MPYRALVKRTLGNRSGPCAFRPDTKVAMNLLGSESATVFAQVAIQNSHHDCIGVVAPRRASLGVYLWAARIRIESLAPRLPAKPRTARGSERAPNFDPQLRIKSRTCRSSRSIGIRTPSRMPIKCGQSQIATPKYTPWNCKRRANDFARSTIKSELCR